MGVFIIMTTSFSLQIADNKLILDFGELWGKGHLEEAIR
jgi:hypothetical protein